MSIVKRFISEAMKNAEIDEFLQKKLSKQADAKLEYPINTHAKFAEPSKA